MLMYVLHILTDFGVKPTSAPFAKEYQEAHRMLLHNLEEGLEKVNQACTRQDKGAHSRVTSMRSI